MKTSIKGSINDYRQNRGLKNIFINVYCGKLCYPGNMAISYKKELPTLEWLSETEVTRRFAANFLSVSCQTFSWPTDDVKARGHINTIPPPPELT